MRLILTRSGGIAGLATRSVLELDTTTLPAPARTHIEGIVQGLLHDRAALNPAAQVGPRGSGRDRFNYNLVVGDKDISFREGEDKGLVGLIEDNVTATA